LGLNPSGQIADPVNGDARSTSFPIHQAYGQFHAVEVDDPALALGIPVDGLPMWLSAFQDQGLSRNPESSFMFVLQFRLTAINIKSLPRRAAIPFVI
jgi:hypothetical protein